ncbi:MAG TPA: Xaa-Pro peptidase family protein [Gemmataceae bacterium]|jgi:Xaa-Pro aminopeptidase|nr:Xaa-Pro peptidase family protein [Gemmataceae bacterium]
MLTAEGCRQRRLRLWERLKLSESTDHLVLGDRAHLRYFANFSVDPISLAADFSGLLLVRRDGHATLFHDNRIPSPAIKNAQVDDFQSVPWYDGQSPGRMPRQLVPYEALTQALGSPRVHDHPADPLGPAVVRTVTEMRRQKDADELELLRRCMLAGKAGQDWAKANFEPGMTELDVYNGVAAAVNRDVGRHVITYGDFAVCTGPDRRGGPPTDRALKPGDTLILDYSVVLYGYRSDFTNTLVVGGEPTPQQRLLFQLCSEAMYAGEQKLKAGASCQDVYDAVRDVFEKAKMADQFPHHAGHGLGLMHAEAPYIVRHSTETLLANDVITLEPGLYVPGVEGVRIEHNYLITEVGFERLSNHGISLDR